MKKPARFTRLGKEIIEGLSEFHDALKAGEPMEKKFTVGTVKLDGQAQPLRPADVKRIRAHLNASQAVFAAFGGVDVKTVRAWEQGLRKPNPMACRFLGDIARRPAYWQQRLSEMIKYV